ncbi:hypothetical protein [Paenibacillus sp. PL91]|uniref:hypothetical protein n=1 Tax=Paenibacillus sp. PL91 TaxID=2729538 RepID=UPI00145D9761|nr:hypothetical protein [Paenibacillus sp. PL91]MBC9199778.1 hypothetical protein [Paenibacillus sp. PL91]
MTTTFKIDRFNVKSGSFEQGSVSIYRTYTIGFVICGRSGNKIVTFCNPSFPARSGSYRQQIVVLPGAFHRILPDVDRNVVAGCTEATPAQLSALGFIVKRGGYPHVRYSIANAN